MMSALQGGRAPANACGPHHCLRPPLALWTRRLSSTHWSTQQHLCWCAAAVAASAQQTAWWRPARALPAAWAGRFIGPGCTGAAPQLFRGARDAPPVLRSRGCDPSAAAAQAAGDLHALLPAAAEDAGDPSLASALLAARQALLQGHSRSAQLQTGALGPPAPPAAASLGGMHGTWVTTRPAPSQRGQVTLPEPSPARWAVSGLQPAWASGLRPARAPPQKGQKRGSGGGSGSAPVAHLGQPGRPSLGHGRAARAVRIGSATARQLALCCRGSFAGKHWEPSSWRAAELSAHAVDASLRVPSLLTQRACCPPSRRSWRTAQDGRQPQGPQRAQEAQRPGHERGAGPVRQGGQLCQ